MAVFLRRFGGVFGAVFAAFSRRFRSVFAAFSRRSGSIMAAFLEMCVLGLSKLRVTRVILAITLINLG